MMKKLAEHGAPASFGARNANLKIYLSVEKYSLERGALIEKSLERPAVIQKYAEARSAVNLRTTSSNTIVCRYFSEDIIKL